MKFDFLECVSGEKIKQNSVFCITLAHNEMNILPDFLAHYRSMGNISFLIVDDHSTDGSLEYLKEQPDVTVFSPVEGSTYSEHKRIWRRDLMNHYCHQEWCLMPDVDEHFVHLGMEERNIHALIEDLEEEGAQTVLTGMLDMYADKPLSEHHYNGGGLRSAFEYFDGQSNDFMSYRLQKVPRRYLANYPTPK
ncbi:MAG: glycosyltransferase family 2 protein, partial [Nitratireductor sp.]